MAMTQTVAKYLEENADDFPLAAGWGPAARTIIATAYGAERAANRADLEQLEENLAKEAMGLLGKARGAKALLKRNPSPMEAEVRAALDRNLCRCGSHNRMVRAVLRAAAEMAAS